jgi:ATP-dependent DNA ligase
VIEKRTFPSASSNATYTTTFDTETRQATCDCRGWTVKRGDKPRECKHTREVLSVAGGSKPSETLGRTTPKDAPIKPMLASPMKEDQTLADFTNDGWVMEEKFDGHRLSLVVTTEGATAWARGGGDRPQLERPLPSEMVAHARQLPAGVYDGELCVPGGTSSDVTRLDRKDDLVLVLFDAVQILGRSLTALPLVDVGLEGETTGRRGALELAVQHAPRGGRIRIATQQKVSAAAIQKIWDDGGEGAILKRKASTYRPGWRTPDWVKVKAIGSAELTLVAFEAGKMGPQSVMRLRHDDGRETTVKVLGNEWLRIFDADPKKYIGKRVTISFMGMTTGNVWRHPQFDAFVDGDLA